MNSPHSGPWSVLSAFFRNFALMAVISAGLTFLAAGELPDSPGVGNISLVGGSLTWGDRMVNLSYTLSLDTESGNRLGAASRAEELVREHLLEQVPSLLLSLRIDSRTLLEDYFRTSPDFLPRLMEAFRKTARFMSNPSKNLKNLELRISIPLDSLYSEILGTQSVTPLEKVFTWQPSKEYSGVIIYMKEKLEWFGQDEKTSALPGMLINIQDSKGRKVFSVDNMNQDLAVKWGTCAYMSSVEAARKNPRVGANPLVLSAQAVFGVKPVDPVLSVEDANLLLFNNSTRKALAEGRIIIILPESTMGSDLLPPQKTISGKS